MLSPTPPPIGAGYEEMKVATSYTNEQIRGAILRAADRIEANPASYAFDEIRTPLHYGSDGNCGAPFCMLGWIGFELKSEQWLSHYVACEIFGKPTTEQIAAAGVLYDFLEQNGFGRYHSVARVAAAGMRAFADAKFPATQKLDAAYLAFRDSFTHQQVSA